MREKDRVTNNLGGLISSLSQVKTIIQVRVALLRRSDNRVKSNQQRRVEQGKD
jgi:hypothetical protein